MRINLIALQIEPLQPQRETIPGAKTGKLKIAQLLNLVK
jgi:hypothetical protein